MAPERATPRDSKRHVALVAWGFPPSRASGVYRALALANAFVEGGAAVTVVTADEHYFQLVTGTDDSLLAHVNPAVDVVRVSYPPGRLDPVISRWPSERVERPSDYRRDVTAYEMAYFPERLYGPWRPALEQAIHDLHQRSPIDVLVATGNPYTSYAAAAHLSANFNVPYVLDDRDGWLMSVYTGEARDELLDAEIWVRGLLEQSLESWFVNPPIVQWHQNRFPLAAAKIHSVENGWDRTLLDPSLTARQGDGPRRLGYIGTINAGFPLDVIIEGWREARGRTLPDDAELHLFGPIGYQHSAPHHERLLNAARKQGVVRRGGWPKARIAEAYAELDVLLYAREGGPMITTGKIYEYLATGKPIAVVSDATQDSRRVLTGYERAYIAPTQDAPAIAVAYGDAFADASSETPTRLAEARAFGARLRRDHAVEPAVRRILDAIRAERTGAPSSVSTLAGGEVR